MSCIIKKRKRKKNYKDLTLDEKKDLVGNLSYDKVIEYFLLGVDYLKKTDKEVLKHQHQQARLGFQMTKEQNLQRRADTMTYIRISKMVSSNLKEMREYLKHNLPKYYSG